MEDRDFLDLIYQQWSKTTGADNTYWMPEEYAERFDGYRIYAVDQDQKRELVAQDLTEADAEFLTAIHGCLPDLVRRTHQALDEAERFDSNRDERECRIAELEIENQELREKIAEQEMMLDDVGR